MPQDIPLGLTAPSVWGSYSGCRGRHIEAATVTSEDDVWFMARDLHQDYGRRHIHKEYREAMMVYLSNRLNGSKPL